MPSEIEKFHARLLRMTEDDEAAFIKRIEGQYREAYNGMKRTLTDYAMKYGEDNIFSGKRFYKFNRSQKMISQMFDALRSITVTNRPTLSAYLADQYFLNYFYTGYALESQYQVKLSFRALDRKAVLSSILSPFDKIALQSNAEAVRIGIQRAVTQGIAQGDGIPRMAKRVESALEKNANNAAKIARTETTGVMNNGRLAAMEHSARLGLPLQKRWVATLDTRTRDRHAHMDGEIVDIDKPFSNGLMYPGDQTGDAAESINCRCTMIEVLKGFDSPKMYRRARGVDGKNKVIPDMTYKEWGKARVS